VAININVNGESINYPQTGDTNWSDEATDFAVQTASALGKIGLSSGTTVDIPGTLDVTGNTTLDANLSVGGNASVTGNATITGNLTANGNSNFGNASGDTIAVTGILNVDSGVLYVNPTSNQVGINKTNPSQALDVTGNVAITGNETVGGTLGVTGNVAVNTNKFNITATSGNTTIAGTLEVTGDVAVNTNKFNITASSGNTTIAGTLGVTSDITTSGILTASNSTNVTTAPPITFTGDTNTGIGRSAADTLDFITNGNSRFRIESTGQIKAVYESTIGTDYNAILHNGYLCRAWVNFDGTLSNTTGTYTRSGTTITCSITSHGLTTGQTANLDFTSGGATDGIYVVTVTNANTFTVEDTVSGTITTSNVTMLSRMIRASGNVSSITDNGVGAYTVNYTTAMVDINYATSITSGDTTNFLLVNEANYFALRTVSATRIDVLSTNLSSRSDSVYVSFGVFR